MGNLNWLLTYRGIIYKPFDPRPEDIDILDIAHALSMLCRYTGHTKFFYCVAEHSLHVSHMVPEEFAFEALLHDASEAYVGDMSRPVKWGNNGLTAFNDLEKLNDIAMRIRFGLPHEMSPDVKACDSIICRNETDELFGAMPADFRWDVLGDPRVKIQCWSPNVAEIRFLERFNELLRRRA